MNTAGLKVTTPTDTTIVLTRTFNAPRRLVWEAMTVPAKMLRWMQAPPGWSISVCECEARVGGILNLAFKNDEVPDQVMTLKGVFTEASPHERMVHSEKMEMGGQSIGSLMETHEFAEKDGITSMRITQVYASKEDRDGAVASGADQGMELCYQRMDAMFAQNL